LENSGRKEIDLNVKNDWENNPAYIICVGALCGGPPSLKCVSCGKTDYELFYGHCKNCAKEKEIPQDIPGDNSEFDGAVDGALFMIKKKLPEKDAESIVIKRTKDLYPWWHWRRWL